MTDPAPTTDRTTTTEIPTMTDSTDQAERTKLYMEAQKIFKEEAPWVTIAHSIVYQPVRKEVLNWRIDPFGGNIFYGVDLEG